MRSFFNRGIFCILTGGLFFANAAAVAHHAPGHDGTDRAGRIIEPAQTPSLRPERVEYPISTMETILNSAAKAICGDHFITGIPVDTLKETLITGWFASDDPENAAYTVPSEYYPATMARAAEAVGGVSVDEKTGLVQLQSGPYVGKARYFGDQGCAILNPYLDHAYFDPVTVPREKADDDLFPKDGDLLSRGGPLPSGYDRTLLEAAIEEALHPDKFGVAMLVMHKGETIIERYAKGVTKDTPTLNWSMGKSILGALIGRLDALGALSLDDPAPVDAWYVHENDPRQNIKIIDLMRMSAGLSCTRNDEPWLVRGATNDHADHNIIYAAPIDVVQNAILSPYAHAPNERYKYNNCDMQALGYIIKKKIAERGEDYLTWPYVELYNKIGMSGMVSEVDTYGNFHLTGFDYGTARDWARYGVLHLNEGVWNGERIVSQDFIDAARTPGPVWGTGEFADVDRHRWSYGATHWLNERGDLALPRDAYYPQGLGDNAAYISPSEELVIVILRLTNFENFNGDVLKTLTPGLGIDIAD
ncbi:MAG: serine hydrolase [Pseudomonadota bacterium]